MEKIDNRGSLLDTMRNFSSSMTKKQQLLSAYIVENYKEAAFMNSKELAQKAQVSESTVFRLAFFLGYPGFPEFQDALREILQNRMAKLEKINLQNGGAERTLLGKIIDMEKNIMSAMESQVSTEDFDLTVQLLCDAEKVLILGYGADQVSARYLDRFLSVIRKNVHFISAGDDPGLFEFISGDESNTIAVAYHFPRYYRKTIDVAKLLQEHKIRIIGISDSILSPLAPYANPLLSVPMKYYTYIDPIAATSSLTHALMTGVILKQPKLGMERIRGFYEFSNKMQRCYWEGLSTEIGIGEN